MAGKRRARDPHRLTGDARGASIRGENSPSKSPAAKRASKVSSEWVDWESHSGEGLTATFRPGERESGAGAVRRKLLPGGIALGGGISGMVNPKPLGVARAYLQEVARKPPKEKEAPRPKGPLDEDYELDENRVHAVIPEPYRVPDYVSRMYAGTLGLPHGVEGGDDASPTVWYVGRKYNEKLYDGQFRRMFLDNLDLRNVIDSSFTTRVERGAHGKAHFYPRGGSNPVKFYDGTEYGVGKIKGSERDNLSVFAGTRVDQVEQARSRTMELNGVSMVAIKQHLKDNSASYSNAIAEAHEALIKRGMEPEQIYESRKKRTNKSYKLQNIKRKVRGVARYRIMKERLTFFKNLPPEEEQDGYSSDDFFNSDDDEASEGVEDEWVDDLVDVEGLDELYALLRDAEARFADAMVRFSAFLESIKSMFGDNAKELKEFRSFTNPPEIIQMASKPVGLLQGFWAKQPSGHPHEGALKVNDWPDMVTYLRTEDFPRLVFEIDPFGVSAKRLETIKNDYVQPFLPDKFTEQRVFNANLLASKLVPWTIHVIELVEIAIEIKELKKKIAALLREQALIDAERAKLLAGRGGKGGQFGSEEPDGGIPRHKTVRGIKSVHYLPPYRRSRGEVFESNSFDQRVAKACHKQGLAPPYGCIEFYTEENADESQADIAEEGTTAFDARFVEVSPVHTLDASWTNAFGSRIRTLSISIASCANTLCSIRLKACRIDDSGVCALSSSLRASCPHLEELDISRNDLTENALLELAPLLRNAHPEKSVLRLKTLILSSNDFHALSEDIAEKSSDGRRGLAELAFALKANRCLETLELSRCHLDDREIRDIMCHVFANNTLRSLDLSWNRFSESGVQEICGAIKEKPVNTSISHLNLSCCALSAACGSVLGALLAENQNITQLNLSCNAFGSQGAKNILSSLSQNGCLITLSLENCHIGPDAADFVTNNLKKFGTLEHLNLRNNRLYFQIPKAPSGNPAAEALERKNVALPREDGLRVPSADFATASASVSFATKAQDSLEVEFREVLIQGLAPLRQLDLDGNGQGLWMGSGQIESWDAREMPSVRDLQRAHQLAIDQKRVELGDFFLKRAVDEAEAVRLAAEAARLAAEAKKAAKKTGKGKKVAGKKK